MVKKQTTTSVKSRKALSVGADKKQSAVVRKTKSSAVKNTVKSNKKPDVSQRIEAKSDGAVTSLPIETEDETIVVADEQLIEYAEFNKCITENQSRIIRRVEQKKRIDSWYSNGLISSNQQNDLYGLIGIGKPQPKQTLKPVQSDNVVVPDDTMTQSGSGADTVFWIRRISLFAVGCIMLGLIAMIAANWHSIPNAVKLFGYFGCFMAFLSGLFMTDYIQQKTARECALWCNVAWIFAGIGLISQIFQLSGTFCNALLYGSVLATPFILSSRLPASLILWAGAYCIGAIGIEYDAWSPLLVMAILPVVLWKKDNGAVSVFWWIAIISSLFKSDWFDNALEYLFDYTMPVTFAGVVLLTLLLAVGVSRRFVGEKVVFTQAIQVITLISAVCLVLFVDVAYTTGEVRRMMRSELRGLISLIYLFGGLVTAFVMTVLFLPKEKWQDVVKLLGVFGLVAFVYNLVWGSVFGFIFTVICLLGISIYAVRRHSKDLFNWCLVLMVIRIAIAYVSVILSLESLGFTLISFGVVLLGSIGAYIKGYPLLMKLMERKEGTND